MNKLYTKPEEAVELLRNLLNFELKERESIGRDFHGKKSELAVIGLLLDRIDKDAELGKFKVHSIREPRKILSANMNALGKVSRDIYPKAVNFMGLTSSIKQLVSEVLAEYGLEIQITISVPNSIQIDTFLEVGIYLLCADLFELFKLLGNTCIFFKIKTKENKLEIEIDSLEPGNNDIHNIKAVEKLKIIKGRLIWHNAFVFTETNWKNYIKLSFDVASGCPQ